MRGYSNYVCAGEGELYELVRGKLYVMVRGIYSILKGEWELYVMVWGKNIMRW